MVKMTVDKYWNFKVQVVTKYIQNRQSGGYESNHKCYINRCKQIHFLKRGYSTLRVMQAQKQKKNFSVLHINFRESL